MNRTKNRYIDVLLSCIFLEVMMGLLCVVSQVPALVVRLLVLSRIVCDMTSGL